MPVACAKALGGVDIGSTMAKEEPMAIPISNVSTPPKGNKFSRILTPAIAKMGTNKAAVAV